MTVYSAESFFRAKISQSITESAAVPITVRLSKLPTLTNGLLTISPNTEYEEIVEYNNPQAGTMTVDIIKRGIKPDSILLTTNGVDYNNVSYMRAHTQNDVIRGDVNHIHINQGIGNSTLATNTGVGITKLSVAAADIGDPIAVGTNDPRVGDASTTQKATVKLSVAPVSASNPIAVGDNDSRLSTTVVSANGLAGTVNSSNDITLSTTVTGIMKGNGTIISAATEGTDYYKPDGVDVVVADGGTGRSTATAYAPIFGGTTSTGPLQSGTVGTIGQVLTSNGAGALPTFQPGIVTNGTRTHISATASNNVGDVFSSETGVLSSHTIALVNLYSNNGTSYLEIFNGSWQTLYFNNSFQTTTSFTFLLKGGYNYRIRANCSINGGSAAGELIYTI